MDADYLEALLGESAPAQEARDVWVVAETGQSAPGLSPATLEVLGAARGLADRLGAYVRVALLGAEVTGLTATLIAHGADRVALAEDARLAPFDPETHLAVLSAHFTQTQPEVLLLTASAAGDELAARLAVRLGAGLACGCTALDLDETTRTVIARRPAYTGLYEEEWVIPQARPQIFTLRPGVFSALPADPWRSGEVEAMSVSLDDFMPRVHRLGSAEYAGPTDHHGQPAEVPLHRAQRVVAVGRGLGAQSDVALARQLADRLGAVLAGDHTAYELGWVDDRHVVGITGATVAPELYVACGIRGDAQHLAGMSGSGFVVAIHADPEAPIFQTADLGIIGPPAEVLQALLGQI